MWNSCDFLSRIFCYIRIISPSSGVKMVAAFGRFAGDIVLAIKIIAHIVEAFGHERGAKKQYAKSCGFLRQLLPILEGIEEQIPVDNDGNIREDIAEHAQAIKAAYDDFDRFPEKRYQGLSSRAEASKIRQILNKVRWCVDELREKVQKFKSQISNWAQLYGAYLTQKSTQESKRSSRSAPT